MVFLGKEGNKLMSQIQGRTRSSYVRSGVYISGSNALKTRPSSYASSNESAAPRPRVQEVPNYSHRAYFENTRRQAALRAEKEAKIFSKTMCVLISLAAVVFVMGCMWITQLASYKALEVDLAAARSSMTRLQVENKGLEQQLVTLKDGARIRNYAVNRLGMVSPEKSEERTISIILPRTQEAIASAQEERHYTLLDVLVDMLWF